MLEVPTVAWDVSALEVAAAVAMFGVGLVTHEAMHLGALEALHLPYSATLMPDGLRGLFFSGGLVRIDLLSMPARWRVAVAMLAPAVMAMPPLVAYAVALSYPVLDAGVALVIVAWFIAAIPSPHDVLTVATYDPAARVPTEVAT